MATSISSPRVLAGGSRPSAQATAPRVVAGALLFWWVLHLGILLNSGSDLSRALQATEEGSWLNQFQVGLLGALGLTAIFPALKRLRRAGCSWPYWFLAYVSWSGISLFWSLSPELGIRRFGEFLLISVGSIGIGAGYYGRSFGGPFTLLKHLWLAGVVAVIFCIPVLVGELSIDNLLDPAWTTSLRAFGPEVGFAAGFALIGSLAVRRIWSSHISLFGKALTIALFALLLLLKSRSLVAFTIVVFTVVYVKIREKTPTFIAVALISLATFLLVSSIAAAAAPDPQSVILAFIARGDSPNALTLVNGRVPLWLHVWNDALQHLWFGVGFGSYWTSAQLSEVWSIVQWKAPFAHNGYLEELVQTGIIGLSLFAAFCFAAVRDLMRRMRGRVRIPVVIVLAWLAMFLLLNLFDSILQFYFKVPFFFTLTALSACCAAETFRPRATPFRSLIPHGKRIR
jgi:exopolysaccharide production protein ExoQ